MKTKALFLLSLFVCTLVLTGCNTVRGMGEDLERAGQAIQRESSDAQD